MQSPQYGFFSWNQDRSPDMGGPVGDWLSSTFTGDRGPKTWDADVKSGLFDRGTSLIGGWIGGRQQAKSQAEVALLQQQIALAELQAQQQQAAANRKLLLALAALTVGGVIVAQALRK
jgi:hypothetical protein